MKLSPNKKEWEKEFPKPVYNCRFHPINGWHEVGCPHKEWTKEQLQDALNKSKSSQQYQLSLLSSYSQTLIKRIEGMRKESYKPISTQEGSLTCGYNAALDSVLALLKEEED